MHRRPSCLIARRATAVLVALAAVSMGLVPAQAKPDAAPGALGGTFELARSLTFHVVNPAGEPFTIRIRVRDERSVEMDRPVLVRVFDPQESLIVRYDFAGEREVGEPRWHDITLDVPASQSGVYQVAITGFGGWLEFATSPLMAFGVYGAPQLVGRAGMFADTYVYLPPGLDQLSIRHDGALESLSLIDEAGVICATLDGSQPSVVVSTSGKAGQVWRLSVKGAGRFALDFAGLPVVLCPSVESARAIHASVDVLDDGTICFHKFQARIHGVLKRYRAMDPQDFEVQPPVLARYRNEWLAQPVRNQLLLGPYGAYSALPATLHEQNLDPSSPWFGSIGVWRSASAPPRSAVRLDNPWTTCSRLGLSRISEPVSVLAAVYSIDAPFNPLHGNTALRNRIIIAALQDLMLLREYELPDAAITDYFGGERSLNFSRMTQSFPLVIRDCPDDVRAVWTEGLRRYVDRQSIGQVASTVNQWTFIPVGVQDFYEGTGETWYSDIVARHIRWMLTRNQWNQGLADAGYFAESEGPDATYTGITLHNLAWLWERTRNPDLLAAIDKCLRFFNLTIAPEPDGTWLGSTSFSHRTPGDWTSPQWGAGLGILADNLACAAVHDGRTWPISVCAKAVDGRRRAQLDLTNRLAYLPNNAFADERISAALIASGPALNFRAWQHHSEAPIDGKMPLAEVDRFTQTAGGEALFARRPAYFAFVYAGAPMAAWQKERRPTDAHQQFPNNGGGLCMFWSPRFGTSILGKNWSAYSAQNIIAERADGGADWEDYWSVHAELDDQSGVAVARGTIRGQPMAFHREAKFLDAGVVMDLQLHSNESVNLRAMWECFPFPLNKPGGLRAIPVDAQGRPVRNAPAQAVVFRGQSDEVHLLVFDSLRMCDVGVERSTDVYGKPHEHGRVLAALPSSWTAGMSHRARWVLMAVDADAVQAGIVSAQALMKP